jgi:hypothetical protein
MRMRSINHKSSTRDMAWTITVEKGQPFGMWDRCSDICVCVPEFDRIKTVPGHGIVETIILKHIRKMFLNRKIYPTYLTALCSICLPNQIGDYCST